MNRKTEVIENKEVWRKKMSPFFFEKDKTHHDREIV